MTSSLRRIGRLAPSSSMLFVCDIQEAFRRSCYQLPTVVQGTSTLVTAANELQVPVLVTTQNAARLGDTVSEIKAKLDEHPNVKTFDKTLFSMWTSEVQQYFDGLENKPKSIILCGIEGHVCVLQTCLDLLENGFDVHVVSDAVSSSTGYNRSVSLERMRQAGAFISSVEMSIFQLAGDAKNPHFRAVSKLIKEHLKVPNGFDVATPRL